jgi:ABC-type phosphate transport system substrate-binding protein
MRALAILLVVLGLGATAAADGYKVIVNPASGVTEIDRDTLRDIYLKKTTDWNGTTARPVDLTKRFPAREDFTRDVLHKSLTQLKSYWSQQIFTGKGVPPPEADSPAAAVAYVLADKGAIGYVPADADTGGAKVIRVK